MSGIFTDWHTSTRCACMPPPLRRSEHPDTSWRQGPVPDAQPHRHQRRHGQPAHCPSVNRACGRRAVRVGGRFTEVRGWAAFGCSPGVPRNLELKIGRIETSAAITASVASAVCGGSQELHARVSGPAVFGHSADSVFDSIDVAHAQAASRTMNAMGCFGWQVGRVPDVKDLGGGRVREGDFAAFAGVESDSLQRSRLRWAAKPDGHFGVGQRETIYLDNSVTMPCRLVRPCSSGTPPGGMGSSEKTFAALLVDGRHGKLLQAFSRVEDRRGCWWSIRWE